MINKFTENEIENFINSFYIDYKNNPKKEFLFDFSKYTWISNQNLLLLTSLLTYLYNSKANFKIRLFNSNYREITKNQKKTIIQLWEVWKLFKVFDRPNDTFENYILDFSNSIITQFKKDVEYKPENNIYNRMGITPFFSLNKIDFYNDYELLSTEIKPIFDLNAAILNELKNEKSEHPFIEETISAIVTRELYENFLDHYEKSFFTTENDMCFLSISLKRKLGRNKLYIYKKTADSLLNKSEIIFFEFRQFIQTQIDNSYTNIIQLSNDILTKLCNIDTEFEQYYRTIEQDLKIEDNKIKQSILKSNIESEELKESEDFFKDNDGSFKNLAYVQFTFIDYGQGIPNSIFEAYCIENEITNIDIFNKPSDNELLIFALKHNTSRFPILDKFNKTDKFIPRGLFDVISIVQRYKGLMIIRSNNGKVIIDFSKDKDIEDSIKSFGKLNQYFPGTYITIYFPELDSKKTFKKEVIRYEPLIANEKMIRNNINIFTLIGSEFISKDHQYSLIFQNLKSKLSENKNKPKLSYVNFFGINDRNIISKLFYFLISDYEINKHNSVIILNPPEKELVKEIQNEIYLLSKTIKNYKIHPLPLVYFRPEINDVELAWLGVYDEDDKKRLDNLLFDDFSLSITDFYEPSNALGNVISADNFGNIKSTLPNKVTLVKYHELFTDNLLKKTIEKFKLLKSDGLYLCNGNYYQNSFLQLSEILDNKVYRNAFSFALFQKIKRRIIYDNGLKDGEAIDKYIFNYNKHPLNNKQKLKFITVTSSSHKLIKSLIHQGFLELKAPMQSDKDVPYISFENYLDFESSSSIELLEPNTDYILICDAISTGNLVRRMDNLIAKFNSSKLLYIGVLVNNLDNEFEETKEFELAYQNKLIFLSKLPIKKKRQSELLPEEHQKELIRVNPFTNLPIEFEEKTTLTNSIIYKGDNKSFIELISEDDIEIRFQIRNNLIHPFYFNIGSILYKENEHLKKTEPTNTIIENIFNNKEILNHSQRNFSIFYPKDSGIQYLNKSYFNSKISKNQIINFFELERITADSGWKFPNSSSYIQTVIDTTKNVIILDDGTCTGDSLYQMINEISYFEPERIDLVCIVSRVDDYKREFFSKLRSLKCHSDTTKEIKLNIFFGSQWHVPTFYLNNNPYSEEIKWIKKVRDIKNTPIFIKKNAEKILNTITPEKNKILEYKYFPKIRGTRDKIPKKDILITRNEIGKLTGFRFYKESFDWLNEIKSKRNNASIKNRENNKDIELISMCFLYEPYIYKIITKSFPDIKAYMEDFLICIFFKEFESDKININTDLYFDWTFRVKDLIHLLFIVFDEETLINLLNIDNTIKLLNFHNNKSNTNYFLYKLTKYFSISSDDLSNKNEGVLQTLLNDLIMKGIKDSDIIQQYKIFISTLPLKTEFINDLMSIKQHYLNQENMHATKEQFGHNISAFSSIIGKIIFSIKNKLPISKEDIAEIRKNWLNITEFVNPVLKFTSSYPDFITPIPFNKLFNQIEGGENSVRIKYGDINNVVYAINEHYENDLYLEKVDQYIKDIQILIDNSSLFYKIIENNTTKIAIATDSFINKLTQLKIIFDKEGDNIQDSFYCNIPTEYVNTLIISELINNIQYHCDSQEPVKIKLANNVTENKFIINIKNKIGQSKHNSTKEGTRCLNLLSESEYFNFEYESNDKDEVKVYFIQKIIFKYQ